MGNRALRTSERHGFIPSHQLCNSLLHNWFLNAHSPRKPLHIRRMRPAGAPR
jgi:hypothetical protein